MEDLLPALYRSPDHPRHVLDLSTHTSGERGEFREHADMHEMDLWKSWHRDEPRQAEQKVGLGVVVRDLLHDSAVLGAMVEEVL